MDTPSVSRFDGRSNILCSMISSVSKILSKHHLAASAPCRLDSGGTWDIKAMALPLEGVGPVTVNIAVNLRTRVILSPFEDGRVRISSQGFAHAEEAPFEDLPFESPFGLFFAAISYFGCHGLQAEIYSDSPVRSALGGSSTALVALIKALSKLGVVLGKRPLSSKEILHLGYHLEDAVSLGKCGIQDQAAAVYGGVNLWAWHYADRSSPFVRRRLLDGPGQKEMSKHLLLAYSGQSHVSARINRRWIDEFLSGKTRAGWIEANGIVKRLATAVHAMEWGRAAHLLRQEMAIRKEITPDALTQLTETLIHQAEDAGCGARFTGAGGGGCVWATGESRKLKKLKEVWAATLGATKGGRILDCAVEPKGAI
jgi:D-glycero-alpha-D-manno-heptose-7-phosphate kinase